MDFFTARSEIKHLYAEKQISDDFFNAFCNILINANIADSEKEDLLTTSKDLLTKNIISEDLYNFIISKVEASKISNDVVNVKKGKEKASTSKNVVQATSTNSYETTEKVNKILKIAPTAQVDSAPTSAGQTLSDKKDQSVHINSSPSASFNAIGFICAILMMIFAINNLLGEIIDNWPMIAFNIETIIGSLLLGGSCVYNLYTKNDHAQSNLNFYVLCFMAFCAGVFYQFYEFDQHYVPTIAIVLSIITLIGYIVASKYDKKLIKLLSNVLLCLAVSLFIIVPFTKEVEVEGHKIDEILLFDTNVFYVLTILCINKIASVIYDLGN